MRLIFAIIAFVLAGAIFVGYTEPAYTNAQVAQAQVAQYNDALDKATQLQQLNQTLVSRYNAFNPTDLSRLQIMLPDSVNNIGLILDLDSLAGKYGLALQNVDVSSSPAQTTGGNAIGSGSAAAYQSLSLTFSTQGTYSSFLQFMTDLESSLRLVDLTSITISNTGSMAGGQPVFLYKLTLRTYWLK